MGCGELLVRRPWVFTQSDPDTDGCLYSGSVDLCGGGETAAAILQFTDDEIALSTDNGPVWTKARPPGDVCNQAHTLTFQNDIGGGLCDWPDEITITPSV
jgi:hypothetical protein